MFRLNNTHFLKNVEVRVIHHAKYCNELVVLDDGSCFNNIAMQDARAAAFGAVLCLARDESQRKRLLQLFQETARDNSIHPGFGVEFGVSREAVSRAFAFGGCAI